MFIISLTRGMQAFVDDEDRELVEGSVWYPQRQDHTIYAVRSAGLYMHRLLTGYEWTDHVNGNGLDNRRANLRSCTQSQNLGNTRKRRGGTSQYKGVQRWISSSGRHRWRAMIQASGLAKRHLGLFDLEEAAARAYDAAAREAFGDFAAVNFPLPGEQSALRGL